MKNTYLCHIEYNLLSGMLRVPQFIHFRVFDQPE